jgi:uncharacterized protein (TIGR03086 family)
VNDGKAPPIPDSDFTAGDMVATYEDGIKQAVAAFGAPGAMEKMIELPFGTFPGAFFIQLASTDALTHGWDIAKATGQSTDLDPEVAAQLLERARVAIQPAFRGEDSKAPFGQEQQPPANATNADKLAAFLGRNCET